MAINFDFPQWMLRQNTFADSLAKGAQVGAAIANARYRNQALAAQAVQSEREFALREKQLESHNRTADLNFQLQSQLIEDQMADKATSTDWIRKRNTLPLEERVSMPLPENIRLTQTYGILNQIVDNDRMAYERSIAGQLNVAKAKIFGAVPDLAQDYLDATDPDEKRAILKQARERYSEQFKPQEMTTSEGERLVFNPKSGAFRFAPEPIGDEVKTRPIPDEAGNIIGHAMWSGDKWVRIPEKSLSRPQALLMSSELKEVNDLLKNMEITSEEAAKRRTEIATKYSGVNAPATSTAPVQRIRVKAPDGRIGTISAEALEEALKQGYQRVE